MKKNKGKWVKVAIVVLLIIAIIVGIISFFANNIKDKINKASDSSFSYYIQEYKAEKMDLTSYIRGTGQVTSFNIKVLPVPEGVTIKEKYVNDGDIVKAKQNILRIGMDGYNKNIASTIDGLFFEMDDMSGKQYLIYDTNDIGVEIFVSENDVVSLSVDQKAIVRIVSLNKEIEGKISYISKLPSEGKFKVRVKIPYTDDIRFGYGANIKVVIAEKKDVLTIPYKALQVDSDNKYYVIKKEYKADYYNSIFNNQTLPEAAKQYIEVGIISNNTQVEVLSGLNNEDIILGMDW